LIAILEERQVLEFNEPDWDVVLVDEETCEKHEWNNENWCQCHSQLLIREDCTNDESVRASSTVNEDEDTKEDEEGVGEMGA